jgi:hypothetical protein
MELGSRLESESRNTREQGPGLIYLLRVEHHRALLHKFTLVRPMMHKT